eukprot:COSAG01_NODE_67509_length_266_cov_196.916168_1_plen_56_part_10
MIRTAGVRNPTEIHSVVTSRIVTPRGPQTTGRACKILAADQLCWMVPTSRFAANRL